MPTWSRTELHIGLGHGNGTFKTSGHFRVLGVGCHDLQEIPKQIIRTIDASAAENGLVPYKLQAKSNPTFKLDEIDAQPTKIAHMTYS